jgi:hypothetical protein
MSSASQIVRGTGMGMIAVLASCALSQPGDPSEVPSNIELTDNVHVMPFGKAKHPFLAATPHLTYFGGPVIPAVKVKAVYWGSGVNGTANLESFYTAITNSAYFDWLSEYNTPSQSIGRGTFAGSVVDAPPAGTTISDAQIQAELGKRINDGTLPANDANTLYMVHFPPGISITQGGSTSCVQFCAYHGTFTRNGVDVFYGVIPDQGGACASGCGGGTQAQNTTSVASHEMIEAVTDAAVGLATSNAAPLAWYDNTNGEIGDICNGQQGVVAGFTVQKQWSNAQNACILTGTATPPPPPPPTVVLTNGVAVTGLAGAAGATALYKIDVPAGASNLTFAMSGGTGDADLYVKFGAAPTLTSYDYRPYLTGNNETATATTATAGTWYVMINGYAAYTGAQLVASYTTGSTPPPPPPPPPGTIVLSNGVAVTGLVGATGSQTQFTFAVPAGATKVKFAMSGGTGDADVYVKFGAVPTLTSYDYRPYVNGNTETVNATAKVGTWYVMINGYAAFTGVKLVATYQ